MKPILTNCVCEVHLKIPKIEIAYIKDQRYKTGLNGESHGRAMWACGTALLLTLTVLFCQQAPDKCPRGADTHPPACSLGTWPGGGLSCSHQVVCLRLPRNSEASFLTSSRLPSLYNKCRKYARYHQPGSPSYRQGSDREDPLLSSP